MRDTAHGGSPRPPLWAVLGTIVFTALVPGTVVGLGPFLLSGWRMAPPFLGWAGVRWAGGVLLVVAGIGFVDFLVRFPRDGHGTPAPVAPTAHLVVTGPYRWLRNPGYVWVLGLIVGQALVLGNEAVLRYAGVVAIGFHVFVVLYEEPTLRRQFGAEYEEYCRRVPRWVPRRPTS
ncbi:MAG: isoprenylcysteine carboxylmethyltransferase family protein [Candidatus Binatia bacterium]